MARAEQAIARPRHGGLSRFLFGTVRTDVAYLAAFMAGGAFHPFVERKICAFESGTGPSLESNGLYGDFVAVAVGGVMRVAVGGDTSRAVLVVINGFGGGSRCGSHCFLSEIYLRFKFAKISGGNRKWKLRCLAV